MIFGEGPIIKNIAGDLNKLFLQGTRAGQPINNVEGDAAADQATVQLMADRDPVIRDISTGLGWAGREVTVSGTGALQLVNSLGRPLKSWSVELAPFQEGSGDPSSENVRPIHGTNKLTITMAGKNLLSDNTIYQNGSQFPIGAPYTSLYPFHLPAGQYTFSYKGMASYAYWQLKGTSVNNVITTGIPTSGTFILPQDGEYRFWFYQPNGTPDSFYDVQLEMGSTATEYVEPITPTQTVITLPYTIYNGIVRNDGGESGSGEIALDGSQTAILVNWRTSATSAGVLYRRTLTSGIITPDVDWELPNIMGDSLTTVAYRDAYGMLSDACVSAVAGGGDWGLCIRLPDPTLTTADRVNQYLADHPCTVVYGLVDPVQFPLAAPEILTTSGDVSIWITAEDGIVTNFSATYLQSEL